MSLIQSTDDLAAFRERLRGDPVVTVDTEFMREKTYWPLLCLVQVAGADEACCIDPLAPGIDLGPLMDLMRDRSVLKVFHAARQDLEIFHRLMGELPQPIFDTQVAAMVCGFGDQVSYEILASRLAKARIDKTMRFTDWARRPLSDKHLAYALSDVTHLREVYRKLADKLAQTGRAHWLDQEMAALTNPAVYETDPADAWRRLKIRGKSRRFLAAVIELAAWREREAQDKDLPRQRVVRDETLLDIAAQDPDSVDTLAQVRSMSRSHAEGRHGREILEALGVARARNVEDLPRAPDREDTPQGLGPIVDLLKVLLKMKCEDAGVAQKLVASSADLERIAAHDTAAVPALEGWRRELFGDDALALKHGRLALALSEDGRHVETLPVEHADLDDDGVPARG
ncbi:ribonuclease D [Roseospira visakhapatnamensis]|uniref:Ribonuclease D n=1 Tax=Roseospira visakhapatnamensis TaxID=390880 RepID=A0A7W6RH41_9PROT|nr:ribonuclease D [Roseospira visakhapatnamensis]MBB4267886.1 ribonuclease D [Roseospira visakhapatnamensis]